MSPILPKRVSSSSRGTPRNSTRRAKDLLSPAQRAERMSRIRGKGNKSTEGRVASLFRREGITGWRRHAALPGKPDFYFARDKVAVFVHGCFWHGCERCQRRLPVKNREFWQQKISKNATRDRATVRELRRRGVSVLTVWEHELGREHWINRVRRKLGEQLS
jgi:DNA mismatch endonuclease, patch repair protein